MYISTGRRKAKVNTSWVTTRPSGLSPTFYRWAEPSLTVQPLGTGRPLAISAVYRGPDFPRACSSSPDTDGVLQPRKSMTMLDLLAMEPAKAAPIPERNHISNRRKAEGQSGGDRVGDHKPSLIRSRASWPQFLPRQAGLSPRTVSKDLWARSLRPRVRQLRQASLIRVAQSDHHFDPRSPSAEKCPDRAQERHDAVRWCRLGSTDSAEEPEIVVARAIGGSNDEKPIP